MIGELLQVGVQESIVSPSIADKSIQTDELVPDNAHSSKVDAGIARSRQWERCFLYFLTLGMASVLVFTLLSKIQEAARGRLPAYEKGRDYRGDKGILSQGTPATPMIEPEQHQPVEEVHLHPEEGEKDASLLPTLSTILRSRHEGQFPLHDMWGLPMLDHFEEMLPPVVKRGKDEIAAYLAKGYTHEDSDDGQDPYETLMIARTLSNGSFNDLIGMTVLLNNVRPLHGMEEGGQLHRPVRINKLLGTGTSAMVVEVEDTRTHELFAMRIIRQHVDFAQYFDNDASFVAEVQRELNLQEEGARQLCGVIPANMVALKKGIGVPLYTASIAGAPEATRIGRYFIFGRVQLMERLYGSMTVLFMYASDVLEKAREYIGRRLLQTVLKIQQAGVSHNDLKWDNVLLRSDGSFLIADLGSVLPFGKPYRQMTLFTPDYREPHLALVEKLSPLEKGCNIPQASSDLWSLGILLYELFTNERFPYGRAEVDDENDAESVLAEYIFQNKLQSSTLIPKLQETKVPPLWMQLILRLLEPERAKRITAWGVLEEFPQLVQIPE